VHAFETEAAKMDWERDGMAGKETEQQCRRRSGAALVLPEKRLWREGEREERN
jgi:hypothetical protein